MPYRLQKYFKKAIHAIKTLIFTHPHDKKILKTAHDYVTRINISRLFHLKKVVYNIGMSLKNVIMKKQPKGILSQEQCHKNSHHYEKISYHSSCLRHHAIGRLRSRHAKEMGKICR